MRFMSKKSGVLFLLAAVTLPASASLSAQEQSAPDPSIIVNGERPPALVAGPEIKGVISARNGDKIKVTAADGTSTVIIIDNATKIKAGGGLFGGGKGNLTASALLNGLPVTVKTLQASDGLIASQVTFKNNDLKTANMIRNGTAQEIGRASCRERV